MTPVSVDLDENLPNMLIEAEGEKYLYSITDGITLPTLTLEASFGSVLDAKLPDLELAATGTFVQPMSLSETLPGLTLEAYVGGILDPGKLSVMELSMTASGDLAGTLDKYIPGLSITASGIGDIDFSGTLDKDLPPLEISVSLTAQETGSLDKNLSALKISSTGSLNDYGTLNVDIPSLTITAGTGYDAAMTLNAKISTLLMQIVGSGQAGAGSGSTAEYSSRFVDYVLRYSR